VAGIHGAGFADAVDKVLRAAVFEVIAIHRGHHDIFQLQIGDGFGEMTRLVGVKGVGTAVGDIAERAAAGADVAHDHESGGTAAEALRQVGAGGFLAHGMQFLLAQQALDALHFARIADADANPVRLARQGFGGNDLDRDARDLFRAAQLLALYHLDWIVHGHPRMNEGPYSSANGRARGRHAAKVESA
jgi:hypothetical protein